MGKKVKGWYRDIEVRAGVLNKLKTRCVCGHRVLVMYDKAICSYCGKYVFKNKQDEFKYRLNLTLNK